MLPSSEGFNLVLLDIVAVEDFQLALDEVGLIAEHLDLLLVGLDHGQGGFDVLQFSVHLCGSGIDNATQSGEGAGQLPVQRNTTKMR